MSEIPQSVKDNMARFATRFGAKTELEAEIQQQYVGRAEEFDRDLLSKAHPLSKTTHAFYDRTKAEQYGCTVYIRVDGTTVFATALIDNPQQGQQYGTHAGLVTHYVRAWDCGKMLMDKRTPNPRPQPCPSEAAGALEFIDSSKPTVKSIKNMTMDTGSSSSSTSITVMSRNDQARARFEGKRKRMED